MAEKTFARISGTGMYLPPKILTNSDLEKIMDTSDDWIRQRSGIEQRHVVELGVGTSDLAFEAAQRALLDSGKLASELDLILVATLSSDHMFPGVSALLQAKLGLTSTPAMDIRGQCSGFIYSLTVAKALIESGQYKTILVVGAEAHSPALDWSTRGRDVSVLFGDGAGAVVLEASDQQGLGSFVLHTQGKYADKLRQEKPGSSGGTWLTDQDIQSGKLFPHMEGRLVFIHAVKRLPEVISETLLKEKITLDQVDHFLFHQANLRINESVSESMQIPAQKIPHNIQKYGNCSAASIPILLHESLAGGRIKRGDLIVMASFGAGFTWAAGTVRY